MPIRYRRLSAFDSTSPEVAHQALMSGVIVGLSSQPKAISSRFLYDETGSRLFDAICDTPEYYLTRCEHEILSAHAATLAGYLSGAPVDLVDLGAGDGRKTRLVIDALRRSGRDVRYVPIDISETAMQTVIAAMQGHFPDLAVEGLIGEYFEGLHWLGQETQRSRLVLFLGSNLGNFDRGHARDFLRHLLDALAPGDLVLVGFDLRKEIGKMIAAYNDRDGVTAHFTLNLLDRLNRELGGDFDRTRFCHYSTYNVHSGAMEASLVSLHRQSAHLASLKLSFEFEAWEPVQIGYSYKYLDGDIDDLAGFAGFEIAERFYDRRRWFCDALLRVPGA